MDYTENRQDYLEVYPKYLNDLVLTKDLIESAKNYNSKLWVRDKEINDFSPKPVKSRIVEMWNIWIGKDNKNDYVPTEAAIKSFILLELTKSRECCEEVIRFLRESDVPKNGELADGLEKFNKSPGRKWYGNDTYYRVIPSEPSEKQDKESQNYTMKKNPRGRAIIINIVPNEVKHEAERFKDIFRQLHFTTEVRINLTIKKMKEFLTTIAEELKNQKRGNKDNAFVLMIITHGRNEMIAGFKEKGDPEYIAPIADIVNIFSNVDMVKVFFFTCCRSIAQGEMREAKKCETNSQTFVWYSCAEGYETLHDGNYTPYGRALSGSIYQYAHSRDLVEIMIQTNAELERLYHDKNEHKSIGYYAPQGHINCATKKLYFNPGLFEN